MSVVRIRIPEVVVEDKRLGRNLHQDSRSRQYRVGRKAQPTTAIHDRRIPILDQGNLGSCTGNASVGLLGSEPFYDTLDEPQQSQLREETAVEIYSLATQLDPFPGAYQPEDTGSDGLSAAKACRQLEYIVGYNHIMSLEEAYATIEDTPFIFGGLWMSDMDHPNAEGVVRFGGRNRGGHEWLFRGYDATTGLWLCDNSWGLSFGLEGLFKVPDEDFQKQLDQQADATVFVPITEDPPEPTPEPTDHPFPWEDMDPWRHAPHVWSKATRAAKALNEWAALIGHQ
jgi:hypothetical protein